MEHQTNRTIHCEEHGETVATFVCGHLVYGTALGFHAAIDPKTERPDAWCEACEDYRLANGGEWARELERALDIKVLCSSCYDRARARNQC